MIVAYFNKLIEQGMDFADALRITSEQYDTAEADVVEAYNAYWDPVF